MRYYVCSIFVLSLSTIFVKKIKTYIQLLSILKLKEQNCEDGKIYRLPWSLATGLINAKAKVSMRSPDFFVLNAIF